MKPTPFGVELIIKTRIVSIEGNKVVVEGEMSANEQVTASFSGVFYKVKKGHPAYHRWD